MERAYDSEIYFINIDSVTAHLESKTWAHLEHSIGNIAKKWHSLGSISSNLKLKIPIGSLSGGLLVCMYVCIDDQEQSTIGVAITLLLYDLWLPSQ